MAFLQGAAAPSLHGFVPWRAHSCSRSETGDLTSALHGLAAIHAPYLYMVVRIVVAKSI